MVDNFLDLLGERSSPLVGAANVGENRRGAVESSGDWTVGEGFEGWFGLIYFMILRGVLLIDFKMGEG